jgi:hypothetical protein
MPFVGVADVAALQAAADRLSPGLLQRRCACWVRRLVPTFIPAERAALAPGYRYSMAQMELAIDLRTEAHLRFNRLMRVRSAYKRALQVLAERGPSAGDVRRRTSASRLRSLAFSDCCCLRITRMAASTAALRATCSSGSTACHDLLNFRENFGGVEAILGRNSLDFSADQADIQPLAPAPILRPASLQQSTACRGSTRWPAIAASIVP